MISRDGVYYDLTKSHHRTTVNNVTFVFSSRLHKEKFDGKLKDHRKTINQSLTKRFKFCIDVSTLADVVLYRKIETRGFLIEVKEDKLQCVNNIIYAGGIVTAKSSSGR